MKNNYNINTILPYKNTKAVILCIYVFISTVKINTVTNKNYKTCLPTHELTKNIQSFVILNSIKLRTLQNYIIYNIFKPKTFTSNESFGFRVSCFRF